MAKGLIALPRATGNQATSAPSTIKARRSDAPMEFRCTSTPASSWSGDTLAVGLFSGGSGALKAVLEQRFGAALLERLDQRQFKGKAGESLRLEWLGTTPGVLLLVGLGEPAQFGLDGVRQAAASIAKAAQVPGCSSLGIALPVEGLEPQAAAAAIAQAVRLSLFNDQRFKSDSEPKPLPLSVELLGFPATPSDLLDGIDALCSGVELARELVAAPPNKVTPQALADCAAAIAQECGLELKLLERSDCAALGMGAYLGVAQGSDLPPSSSISPIGRRARCTAGWPWWARVSPLIPAATTSRPPAPKSK